MVVAESIRIWSNQQGIRHGILRDFPTHYTGRLGEQYVVGFRLLSVTLDGSPAEAHVENFENGKQIKIGSIGVVLSPGEHTFVIRYATNRQLGFLPEHDELYWNVTGNGWVWTIERASATVLLPSSIPVTDVKLGGYTGAHGSRAQEFTSAVNPDGSFDFSSQRRLLPRQGFTIFLEWPKGYIPPPSAWSNFGYFLEDNRQISLVLTGLLLILTYCLFAWSRVRQDRAPGIIVVSYEPPPGFSPASLRYFLRRSFDNRTFTCAVTSMAVKGFLKIKQAAGVFTLSKAKDDITGLAEEERCAAVSLFMNVSELELQPANGRDVAAAIRALTESLRNSLGKSYYTSNPGYLVPGILIFAAMIGVVLFTVPSDRTAPVAALALLLSILALSGGALIGSALQPASNVRHPGLANPGSALHRVKLGFYGIFLLIGAVVAAFALASYLKPAVTAAILLALAAQIAFAILLRGPTAAGRRLLDRIEGFKMFLGAVEGHRMDRVERAAEAKAKLTPAIFEKFLPYAIALDLEHVWAQKFTGIFASMKAAGQLASAGYSPEWYSGDAAGDFSLYDLEPTFSAPFSKAVSSSAVVETTRSSPAWTDSGGSSSDSGPPSIDSGGWSGGGGGFSDAAGSGGAESGSAGGGGGGGGGSGW